MNNTGQTPEKKTLVQKGFELGRGIDKAFIIGGLGTLAVGAVIAAPAVATFGAAMVGGSIAGIEISKRIERGYENSRAKRKLGSQALKAT